MPEQKTPGRPTPETLTTAKSRSGGPKTPEGKKHSARNATRHGLLSATLCLSTEDQRAFDSLRSGYLEAFQPVGLLELELLEEMVAAKWRQRRVWATETAAIDFELSIQADDEPLTATGMPEAIRTARAIRAMHDDSADLPNYSRYETRFHRMYHRALKQLIEVQDRRKNGKPVVSTVASETPADALLNFPNELAAAPRLTSTQVIDHAVAGAVAAVLRDAVPVPRPLQPVHLRNAAAS